MRIPNVASVGLALALIASAGSTARSSGEEEPQIGSPSGVTQSVDKDSIRSVVHEHFREARYCYEARRIDKPKLQGRIQVRFVIGTNGVVTSVTTEHSSLDDKVVETCLLKAVRRWSFPQLPSAITVTWPFIFFSGSSESGQPSEIRLFDETSRAEMHKYLPAINACYTAQLAADPDTQGRIGLLFTIGTLGGVKDVSVASSTLGEEGMVGCLLAHARTWKFPKFQAGSYAQSFLFGNEEDIDGHGLRIRLPAGPAAQVFSGGELDPWRRSGGAVMLPYSVRVKHLCQSFTARFKVCLGPGGTVASVGLLQGLPGANRLLVDNLKSWGFAPEAPAACFEQRMGFKVGDAASCPQGFKESALPATPAAKMVPASWMQEEHITGPTPRLPDVVKKKFECKQIDGEYRICVDQDGSVFAVDTIRGISGADAAISAALFRWRFKARSTPACYSQALRYQIDGNSGCAEKPATP